MSGQTTTPAQPGQQRLAGVVLLCLVPATATALLGVFLGVNAIHRLPEGIFCWGSLGLATIALLAGAVGVVGAAGVGGSGWSAPGLLVGAVALLAYLGAVIDAVHGTDSARYVTAGLAACLAGLVALLVRAAAVVPGARMWPRSWLVITLGVIAVGAGVWLAMEGLSVSAYDGVVGVALGAAPAGLAVAVLAPLALGAARGADAGIAIRHTGALARAAGVRTLVLDGIGTLVAGKHVTDVLPIDEIHLRNLRWFAGALAHAGDDPVSTAIARLSVRGNLTGVTQSAEDGLSGSVDRHPVRLTRPEAIGLLAADHAVVPGETIGVEVDRRPLGTIRVEDTVRPGAPAAVSELADAGVEAVLISAASGPTAAVVMAETGLTHLLERSDEVTAEAALASALKLSREAAPVTAAVLSPHTPDDADLLYLGPTSDAVVVAEASIEQAVFALRLARAMCSVTRRAKIVAVVGQVLITVAALVGLVPAWGVAIGATVVCGVTWALVTLTLPRGSTESAGSAAA